MSKPATTAILAVLAFAVISVPLTSEAQTPDMVRIGFLDGGSPTPESARLLDAFRQGLGQFGYRDGRNLAIEYRWAEGRYELLPGLATELVQRRVRVIVVGIAQAARAAKEATTSIPVVMVAVDDPVGFGLVQSLARPGGNVTGLSTLSPELAAKQLELLTEAAPKISRVAVLWNAANPVEVRLWRARQAAARVLGLTLVPVEVRSPDGFPTAFSVMAKERPSALHVHGDPLMLSHRRQIVEYAEKNRLPMISNVTEFAEEGGLMSYGAPLPDLFRRAATYVDKILKGAKPADLPIEQPTKFELVVNLRTARALGLAIPPSLLLRADQIIE